MFRVIKSGFYSAILLVSLATGSSSQVNCEKETINVGTFCEETDFGLGSDIAEFFLYRLLQIEYGDNDTSRGLFDLDPVLFCSVISDKRVLKKYISNPTKTLAWLQEAHLRGGFQSCRSDTVYVLQMLDNLPIE